MTLRRVRIPAAAAAGLALAAAAALAPATPAVADELRGSLPSGGTYVLHTPDDWNGTALVWSPGYGGGGGNPSAGPSAAVVDWLLGEGYAVAGASSSTGGWAVEDLLVDQRDLVDVIAAELGEPDDVIAWGSSMGGQVSVALMEAHPDAFDAALPLCGSVAGAIPMLNGSLDGTFALRTLLAPDDERLELVNVKDERARQAAFGQLLDEAQQTPEGRARIALAASLAQVPVWTEVGSAEPHPRDWAEQQRQLYEIFMWGVVSPRQPLEERAGGNFSWNTGVDYSRALVASGNKRLVSELYAQAGLDLRDDLATLAGAERISADPRAVAYMQANATPTGDIAGPVLTLHETGDTAPIVAQARTYADRVRAHGDNALLRQAFVDRPGHCAYADAEIAAMVTALQERLDTGRWANVATPRALNASADAIAARDGLTRGDGSFVSYTPDAMLRPEREENR
ncbi:S9 family peptidase [Microbacterium sp. Marseille-Q6965]|uniref:S9 family peptidase n=1 Tax=Microbacterium sp. Marseille-Q6965 TaxID=2965072 RepID=UPI0021B822A4|nr:S9 family peptidase [Microbacterium sp. Marseille-Q6965]